jgi:predicted nucleic acid-binding Zn ribbon protein
VPEETGPDLARRMLATARAEARSRGARMQRGSRTAGRGASRDRRTGTGAGPDPRDPQPFGAEIRRLLDDRGWNDTAKVARVMGCWDSLVGADLASHCRPQSLLDGELVLVAESTAWATQVRLLSRSLVERLNRELGAGVVRRVRVQGPTTPSWTKGPRRVVGRGPRDTYG